MRNTSENQILIFRDAFVKRAIILENSYVSKLQNATKIFFKKFLKLEALFIVIMRN